MRHARYPTASRYKPQSQFWPVYWASQDPTGAMTAATLVRIRAGRQSTRRLRAKPNAANIAVTPFRNRLSGCTWWTRSGRKNPRNGTAANATPRPNIPEATDRANRPPAITTTVATSIRLAPPPESVRSGRFGTCQPG